MARWVHRAPSHSQAPESSPDVLSPATSTPTPRRVSQANDDPERGPGERVPRARCRHTPRVDETSVAAPSAGCVESNGSGSRLAPNTGDARRRLGLEGSAEEMV